jgi:hypothetical protein
MRHEVTIDPTSGYEDIEAAITELEAKLHNAKRKARSEQHESDELVVLAEASPPKEKQTATQDTEVEPETKPASEAEQEAPAKFNCPTVGDVMVGDKDPRGLVGTSVSAPNNLWAGYEKDKNKTGCLIVGYSATTRVPNSIKKGAYVVEAEGDHYALDAAYHIFKTRKGKKR